ncbi:S10 family peptidase [Granulicella tundricola]|uniref:Peptidase S10 serine carboxypeptidase n=1 Tax=Granulicella tundricola (strain ATCC BAA-1859 / DSM 23138 / MP5ACTX9) TaxID=1198114 RepID=E8WX11_GRATM|nr:peptidase S10 [Granulicella tundricola]ADW68572.1 peptidase S10 serine carboxypeptidase [Granulicella tundricola MP5ACTX9]
MRSGLGFGIVAAAAMLCGVVEPMSAQSAAASRRGTQGEAATAPEEQSVPIPPETTSVTKHDWTGGGQTIHYTATAGNILIRDEKDKVNGSIFYTAYTQDGVESKNRPVTFFYNGGPGAATIWLHMGSFGPVRVITQSPEATSPAPFETVANQYSLIDRSDLVFIDAPLCGFSRAVGKGTAKDFAGTDQDIHAFEQFISRYITVNQRWNSPKFLFGESYGTTRSAGLVSALQNDGIEFNGVTLLSTILNYGVRSAGYDTEVIGYVPSYAAIAWQHNKVKHTGSIADWVEQARKFAGGPYLAALREGDALPPAEFDAIATKLAGFTGLSVGYIKEARLRIAPTRFRKELLRDDDKILGRYDARFEAYDVDAAGENPGFDPSDTGISGAYVAAFHDYIQRELKYMSTEPYYLSGPGVSAAWDFKHRPSGAQGGGGGRGEQPVPDVAMDLADAMRKNPKLRVFSANGYFDLATPFFNTEYDLHHMLLPPAIASNIQFGYYPAGHMVYLNVDALKTMKGDMERFYGEATRR